MNSALRALSHSSGWIGKGVFLIALIFLMRAAKTVFLPVALAVILTFVLSGPVRTLARWGISPPLGAGLVITALMSTLMMFGSSLAHPAAAWWERAPANLEQLLDSVERLRSSLPGLSAPQPSTLGSVQALPPANPLREQLANEGFTLTRMVLAQFWSFVIQAGATVILLYFMLASEHWLLSRTIEALPRRRTRAVLLAGVRQARREISRFLVTMTLLNIGLGVLLGLVLHQIGLPNPILWGTLAAALHFIPYIGPFLTTFLLLLAGTATFADASGMLAPAAAFLVLNAIESNLVGPWVMGRRLQLNPVAIFLAVMAWGWIWGMAGALIAVPVLLAMRTICQRVRRWRIVCLYLNGHAAKTLPLQALLRKHVPSGQLQSPPH